MSVRISVKGEVVTAFLEGELDHHSAKPIREAIDSALELNMPSLLVLDFSGVTFMDSSGVGLVMGRYRLLNPKGGEIHITGTNPLIYKLLMLSGISRLAKMELGGFKVETK